MTTFSIRSSRYEGWIGDPQTGLIHEVAVVTWTDKQIANSSIDALTKEFPPIAIFPVHGDPAREVIARKFAVALMKSLQDYTDKVNAIPVTL